MNQKDNFSVIVREATKEDIPELSLLMNELGYPTSSEEMRGRMEPIFHHPDYKTFIALLDTKIVGMAGASQHYFYEKNGTYVRLVAVVTKSNYRQKGIGKILLDTVENWSKDIGANAVLLNCGNREERQTAHAFYKNRGYQVKSSGYLKNL